MIYSKNAYCHHIVIAIVFMVTQVLTTIAVCANTENRENNQVLKSNSNQVDRLKTPFAQNRKNTVSNTAEMIRYIDFQIGDDANSGDSKERPWKHHPWDHNATAIAKQSKGIQTYVFKGGVIYRGALIANESGLPDRKITLTCEENWGAGKPIFMGTKKLSGMWKKCTPEQFPELNQKVANRIWYTQWDGLSDPKTLYQVKNGEIESLVLAREPDWIAWDEKRTDDVKSDWLECQKVSIDIKIFINETNAFNKDEHIQFLQIDDSQRIIKKIDHSARITAVEKDHLLVTFDKEEDLDIRWVTHISSKRKKTRIKKLSNTHEMITRIYDPVHITPYKSYTDEFLQGGVVWAEDLTGSRVLPAFIDAFNPQQGFFDANFHYNTNGPARFSRYYIENLPFLLDMPGEFYFDRKEKILFVRLKNDQNPNMSHLEAGTANVILTIKNASFIEIDSLSFAGSNELPIGQGTTDYWRGALYNSGIQISGDASHIGITNCNFRNIPNGIISFCSNRPEPEQIEHIVIENNRFEDIGGSAVTLSAISRLRSRILKNGKTGRLRHATLRHNTVTNAGYRRLSLWGFDHALCLVDAELSEVDHNTTMNTAGAGIIVFAPPFFHQFGEHPQLDVPVQRNLIHHNRVENSLLSLQDYGGIAYWHGGPAYIYNNVSINPVGYKHTHYRRIPKKSEDCYRSSCFGIGIYSDHGYKVYAFNNKILGKSGDCQKRFYNSCGWNEAAGFLNTFFNNHIDNYAIPIRKGMTESNRSLYLGNTLTNAFESFFRIDAKHVEFNTLAFFGNTLEGNSKMVAIGHALKRDGNARTIAQWRNWLKRKHALSYDVGIPSPSGSIAARSKNQTVNVKQRVFVPWGIAYPAGEYHFIPYSDKITHIADTHLYWDHHWHSRETVRAETPRNDLIGVNITESDFIKAPLDGWNNGALRLNGTNQYVKNASIELFYPKRNKFILEFFLKPLSTGPLCRKFDKSGLGYDLNVLQDGNLSVSVNLNKNLREKTKTMNLNLLDYNYHHLLVEVDQSRPQPCRIYVDGKSITIQSDRFSLAFGKDRSGQFLIGHDGRSFLECEIDFFRFAHGTLIEAETTIETIHGWQFGKDRSTDL